MKILIMESEIIDKLLNSNKYIKWNEMIVQWKMILWYQCVYQQRNKNFIKHDKHNIIKATIPITAFIIHIAIGWLSLAHVIAFQIK